MPQRRHATFGLGLAAGLALFLAGDVGRAPAATEVVLRDGRTLVGKVAMMTSLAELPKSQPDPAKPQLILLLDDDLRRVYVAKSMVREVRQETAAEVREKFNIRQKPIYGGRQVRVVGPILRVQPFDEYGRRIFSMSTNQGPLDVVQGITEVTPEWTKVEGISHIWDMRVATTSIPRDTLAKILVHQINPQDIEQRKKVARFYIQSERYDDARKELEQILVDFAQNPTVKEQLTPSINTLRQLAAKRLLKELQLRRSAGQHRLVAKALENFPTEGVSGETLQAVKEMVEADAALQARRAKILGRFDQLVAGIQETGIREAVRVIRGEIETDLTANTLVRLAAFVQHMDDEDMAASDRLALGLSGWLLGGDDAVPQLGVAVSAYRVRRAVHDYLNEPTKLNRVRGLSKLSSEEAGAPQLVAKLLAHMKPPFDTPAPAADRPGYYELEVPGQAGQPPSRYLVQLPPEYDPLRHYPTVVTLHGAGTTALNQLDWWAGTPDRNGVRSGQAARHGYIVVAPLWGVEHQKDYGYSAREHAVVLDCLRDACRRFAVDTDRVYLSGHSMGGDAAWDLGLAHPDLWAGVIPIVARSDKTCALYWENARMVPFYFVGGELDGGKLTANARDIDRYLTRAGFNATVVEYQGRGHEDFYDEIQNLFDWMGRQTRNFYPREFTCATMRPWDNFFWWLELSGMPSAAMVDPANFPKDPKPPLQVKGSLTATNGVIVRAGAATVNVWLSPKMLDFNKRISITVNGRRISTTSPAAQPNLQTLLEDVRTRGDRQHPFWAKVEAFSGRGD